MPERRPRVYLDEMGHLWSADRERLHAFAASIGMRRAWFQDRHVLYHYDLMGYVLRAKARAAGAVTVTPREMVGLMRDVALEVRDAAD